MKVGFIQMDSAFGEVEKNNKRIEGFVRESKDADLLVLPELCNTGYMFKDKEELGKLTEDIPDGETVQRWAEICKRYDTYLVGGLAEKDGKDSFNSSVLVGPEGFIGKYRKTHLFFKEKTLFQPGDTGFNVFDTEIGKIGLMICFDYMFPEACRTLALKGADVICNSSCLKTSTWKVMTVMRARALENGVFTITVNRVGEERRETFTGGSEIAGPRMALLAKGKDNEEDVKVVDIDIKESRDKQYNKLNNLIKDRRSKFYREILVK